MTCMEVYEWPDYLHSGKRYVSIPTKIRIMKSMVFPIILYGNKMWTSKKQDKKILTSDISEL